MGRNPTQQMIVPLAFKGKSEKGGNLFPDISIPQPKKKKKPDPIPYTSTVNGWHVSPQESNLPLALVIPVVIFSIVFFTWLIVFLSDKPFANKLRPDIPTTKDNIEAKSNPMEMNDGR